jgi:MFS family permease
MIIMVYFTSILTLALWIPAKSNAAIIVFAAVYGFGSGAFVSLAPALIAQISDVRKIGVRTGSMFAIISVAALVGNPIAGALITRWNGSFTGLQIFCGCMWIGGSTMILFARLRLSGLTLKKKV